MKNATANKTFNVKLDGEYKVRIMTGKDIIDAWVNYGFKKATFNFKCAEYAEITA